MSKLSAQGMKTLSGSSEVVNASELLFLSRVISFSFKKSIEFEKICRALIHT